MSMYRTTVPEEFPNRLEIAFGEGPHRQVLSYEKTVWTVDGETKGLRYGENPDQPAAVYRLAAGTVTIGEVRQVLPPGHLASEPELLQSGKHPGKTNITDTDAGLNIIKHFPDRPAVAIVKHNNPCGVAVHDSLEEAFRRALMADRVAAFGGTVVTNRPVDEAVAEAICSHYVEVVAAPSFSDSALRQFAAKKNVRVLRIDAIERLHEFARSRFLEFTALQDGGLVLQWSFVPRMLDDADIVPAETVYKGTAYRIGRSATPEEKRDIRFGWLVESGVTSNSVIYVRDETTVAIGTGEQDRVGVATIARDKALRNMAERRAFQSHGVPWSALRDGGARRTIEAEVAAASGGLEGSVMVSDAFFPFRDGIDVGLEAGVTAVVQPGGSIRDFESIQACNERGATMAFTGQRSFRH